MIPSPFARVAVLSLVLAACAAPQVREAAPPGAAAPVAPAAAVPAVPATPPVPALGTLADDDLNAVAWQQTALEYRLVMIETFRAATAQLDRALKDRNWDALAKDERDRPARGLPPAVIVDIDETMLDNSPYQVRLIREHRSFNDITWAQWVREAAAKPVPGALDFAKAAARRGITVYYVSNRSADLSDATFDNLRSAGFPIADRSQFLGLGTVLPGCEQVGTEKGCRRRLVGRSHRVLLQIGDQIGDMVSVVANTLAGREAAMAPYLNWIAARWFVLPNPSYGSWEPALFNNDWSQPASERRRQKIEALHFK